MSHDHSHKIGNYNRSFAIGVILNIAFVVIEVGYGVFADSLALIADAGHNLSDVASLLLAWGASVLATKAATEKRTYGFRKATVTPLWLVRYFYLLRSVALRGKPLGVLSIQSQLKA